MMPAASGGRWTSNAIPRWSTVRTNEKKATVKVQPTLKVNPSSKGWSASTRGPNESSWQRSGGLRAPHRGDDPVVTDSDEPSSDRPTTYPAGTSLAEVITDLESSGFDAQFDVDDETGACTCASCGSTSSPSVITIHHARRVEGASDPAEMSNVLGLSCPACGQKGIVACRYGPEASTGEGLLLNAARGAARGS